MVPADGSQTSLHSARLGSGTGVPQQWVLSAYCVPGTVLGTWDTTRNKTETALLTPPTRALQSSGASVGELYVRVLEVPGAAGTRGGDPNLQGVREGFSELH